MSSTIPRRPDTASPRPSPGAHDPRRFAVRLKRASLGLSILGFGLAWTLVSQHVVGATNATPAAASPATSAPGRVPVPAPDFFGQPAIQPQPFVGNGGSGQGGAPIVRGRTS